MNRYRHLVLAIVSTLLLILAGCAGKSGGGYYKDDGPGRNVPANIDAIPNAKPRIEQHSRANLRPYRVFGKRYVPISGSQAFKQRGIASWYGRKFHGKKTANGETYDMYAMTAAHPTLPLPSYARVTRPATGKSVIVRINDRGPFHSSRIIDLSYVAAAKLDLIGPGRGEVIVEAITHDEIRRGSPPPAAPQEAPPESMLAVETPDTPPAVASPAIYRIENTPDALMVLQSTPEPAPDRSTLGPASASDTAALTAHSHSRPTLATAHGQVYLQFGAFASLRTAENLAQELNMRVGTQGERLAFVQASDTLYRVRIGPFATRTAAVNAGVHIERETGLPYTVASR